MSQRVLRQPLGPGGCDVIHPATAVVYELVGRSLLRLVRYEDGPVGLLLADATGATTDYSYLRVIAASWRLLDGNVLLDGSYHETDPEHVGYADQLRDLTIDAIAIESNADTVVALGDLRLVVWSAAAHEPTMMWFRPGAETVIVGPGDTWTRAALGEEDVLHEVGTLAIETVTSPPD